MGNGNVILCERGIRTFEDHTRNTLSLSAVPELHGGSHLPVTVDLADGAGHVRLTPAMSKAAVGAAAEGLLLGEHTEPQHAINDGAQTMTPAALGEMIQ